MEEATRHLDEGHAHGEPERAVGDAHQHLELAKQALPVSKEALLGNHVTKAHLCKGVKEQGWH